MADESMFIEIPLTKGRELIRKAYELSAPRGLGHIHYRKGGLGESEVDEIIAAAGKTGFNRYADMDYVNGPTTGKRECLSFWPTFLAMPKQGKCCNEIQRGWRSL